MAGNAYEWTADWFEPYPNNPEVERLLPYTGHRNGVLRGGSFYHADHAYCVAKRFGFQPDETYYHVGFRCAWTPPEGWLQGEAFRTAKAAVPAAKAEFGRLRNLP
jgi:formylglycine-generating enzyme required for sulfatase activity